MLPGAALPDDMASTAHGHLHSWGQIVLKGFTHTWPSFHLLGTDFWARERWALSTSPRIAAVPALLPCGPTAAESGIELQSSAWCSHTGHTSATLHPSLLGREQQQLPHQLPTASNPVLCTCPTNGQRYLHQMVLLLHWQSVWQKGWFAVSWQIIWQCSCLGIIAVNARLAWNLLIGPDCCGGWSAKGPSYKAQAQPF